MKPGRELDALIAEKVMGLVPCQAYRCPSKPFCHADPESPERGMETRSYSTDISAAWAVVQRLSELGYAVDLMMGQPQLHIDTNQLSPVLITCCIWSTKLEAGFQGSLAPYVICRAALKAFSITDPT